MYSQRKPSSIEFINKPCSCGASAVAMALMLLAPPPGAAAQPGPAGDPVARSMAFIDGTAQATELFNSGKTQEALAMFQNLAANYPDLDEEGFVALSIGDCLFDLQRSVEARAAYDAVLAVHPDLRDTVDQRLLDLDASGEVTDAVIDRLRKAAEAQDAGRYAANWGLGRVLLKKAKSMLDEATTAFRAAIRNPISNELDVAASSASRLDVAIDILNHMIQDLEDRLQNPRAAAPRQRSTGSKGFPGATQEIRWIVRTNQDRRLSFDITIGTKPCETRVSLDGTPIRLSEGQQLLLETSVEEIARLLGKASGPPTSAGPQGK
jgi:hypothetical protein